MILKSVIQEIVLKLIPDLVVILVVISLNAPAFMKFLVFCSKFDFRIQKFCNFWKYWMERIWYMSEIFNGVKFGCRVLFESYFELEMNGFELSKWEHL